jgi:hypothetical protein
MAAMAGALGKTSDQARYSGWLAGYRATYDTTYWNDALASYGKTALEVQTMSAVALGAGAVPAAREARVRAALRADVENRGHHLTVGELRGQTRSKQTRQPATRVPSGCAGRVPSATALPRAQCECKSYPKPAEAVFADPVLFAAPGQPPPPLAHARWQAQPDRSGSCAS